MQKLYVITVRFANGAAVTAFKKWLIPYRSHFMFSENTCIVAAGMAASSLYQDLETTLGVQNDILISQIPANNAYGPSDSWFASWMPVQLAATTT